MLKELKVYRQRSNFFVGREGVVTMRDLIKWGSREIATIEDLGIEGYCLLAERLRSSEERDFIREVIQRKFKIKIDPQQ